jgi:uncharacterized membrane protein
MFFLDSFAGLLYSKGNKYPGGTKMADNTSSTSTGLQENVAGLLCYVFGWITGIIFLIIEPKNKFVRFHAFQSIIVFGILTIASMIFGWIPFINIAIGTIIGVIGFICWIVGIVTASQGKKYKFPFAGNYAEKWSA